MAAPRFTPATTGLELLEEPGRARSKFRPSVRTLGGARVPRIESPILPAEPPPSHAPGTEGERGLLCALLLEAIRDLAAPRPRGQQERKRWTAAKASAQRFLMKDSSLLELACTAAGLDPVALREALAKRTPAVAGLARTRAGRG